MTFPELPTFLNRKLNPVDRDIVRDQPKTRAPRRTLEDEQIEAAWAEAEKEAIRERWALRRAIEKEKRQEEKRLAESGTRIYLAAKLENCPLNTGSHIVELVKRGRKWVWFRCRGRKNCVKTRRIIWDAISKEVEQ